MSKKTHDPVPRSMQVQLTRLFGPSSREATTPTRTRAGWRRTLKAILDELDRYRHENVQTDDLHHEMLYSGLAAAHVSLDEDDDFWPGYVEGIVRFALLLMGDYPDHRRRKGRAKGASYYRLDLHRKVGYVQSPDQQFRTLRLASELGVPGIPEPMWEVMQEFYDQYGYRAPMRVFMRWYKRRYPDAYSRLF